MSVSLSDSSSAGRFFPVGPADADLQYVKLHVVGGVNGWLGTVAMWMFVVSDGSRIAFAATLCGD